MSVIVRLTTDGEDPQIVLYTKGADSVLYGLLDYSLSEETSAVTQDLLNKYGRLGLRTLCLTKRVSNDCKIYYTCTYMYMYSYMYTYMYAVHVHVHVVAQKHMT